ncbi:MAG TPA: methyltransferase [Acetobacteraceae bacterium]|jgi:protein-L-isoaspartate(D-aspartate) O-methyltransferase|nr:methyltransferase [Acetobacteraceae bacterium]
MTNDRHEAEEHARRRRDYARRITAGLPARDPRVESAFAAVPRERFLGSPPWKIIEPQSGSVIETGDLARIYDDVLVQLDIARHVNNGSPSLHALMLHHLGVRPGERILHLGAGAGYYSALLGELAGPDGLVDAVEFDTKLAGSAAANLRGWPRVTLHRGDAAAFPAGEVDRIYVNFGVPAPALRWLRNLGMRGTLEFPLCARGGRTSRGSGVVIAATRTGSAFSVRFVSRCWFVMAEGALAGDAAQHERLAAALERDGIEFVRSLRLGETSPERCWLWTPEWSLSYDEPPA